eukprot:scaffold42954_cov74-Phaeocystis_antarctica.AAC.15
MRQHWRLGALHSAARLDSGPFAVASGRSHTTSSCRFAMRTRHTRMQGSRPSTCACSRETCGCGEGSPSSSRSQWHRLCRSSRRRSHPERPLLHSNLALTGSARRERASAAAVEPASLDHCACRRARGS